MRAFPGLATALCAVFVVCMVCIGLLGGCSDDGRSPTRPPAPAFVEATTPDRLVQNFVSAHDERNIEEYAEALADEFLFVFAPEDVELSPSRQGFWARLQEISSTARMFGGQPGRLPNGDPHPAVENIELILTPVEPDWANGGDHGPEYVGTLRRCYEVEATVSYVASDLESLVRGRQCFYVALETEDAGLDTERSIYRLRFWLDLGRPQKRTAASTEAVSWGELKVRF